MPTWIRNNVPFTWENLSGWRTDIALTTLRGEFYQFAEYHLEDGTILKISMEDMRRALADAPIRNNLMVGPFNIDAANRTVNGVAVQMQKFRRAH